MFRKKSVPTLPPEWLVVGLGNPGPEYKGTRHNVGFDAIDLLADRHGAKLDRSKHRARYGTARIGDTTVLLVKPLTFMNLSGQAVAPLAKEHGIAPDRVLVIADDTDLAPGRLRVRANGSAGGHNGHKSLIASLGTSEYPRVKIGIGRVAKDQTIDHVLGKIHGEEREAVLASIKAAADAVEAILDRGVIAAMNEVNGAGG